jgi:hypothetical protein
MRVRKADSENAGIFFLSLHRVSIRAGWIFHIDQAKFERLLGIKVGWSLTQPCD